MEGGQKEGGDKLISRPLHQSIANRVKALNAKYYLPNYKHTKVITDPKQVQKEQLKEQSTVAPHTASRFNPIYVEPGSIPINCTKDLQTLYPTVLTELVTCLVSTTLKLILKYHLFSTGNAKYQLSTKQR